MKTFIINMEGDEKRFDWMKKECGRLGLTFEKFTACRGDQLDDWLVPQFYQDDGFPHAPLNKGEIGCYASHLSLCKRIVDENITEPVLVLEDDIRFRTNARLLFDHLHKLPTDWEIIRLSQNAKAAFLPIQVLDDQTEIVRYWKIPTSTGAYLINKKGAQKMLTAYPKRLRPIDQDLRCAHEHRISTYGVVPTPIERDIFDSSIDKVSSGRKKSWRLRQTTPQAENSISLLNYRLQNFGISKSLRSILKNLSVSLQKRRGKPPGETDYRIPAR